MAFSPPAGVADGAYSATVPETTADRSHGLDGRLHVCERQRVDLPDAEAIFKALQSRR